MNDTLITADKSQVDFLIKALLLVFSSRNLTVGHTFTTVEDTSFSFMGDTAGVKVTTDYVVDGLEMFEGRETLRISFNGRSSFQVEIPVMFKEPLEFSFVNSGFFLYDYTIALPLRFTMKSVIS